MNRVTQFIALLLSLLAWPAAAQFYQLDQSAMLFSYRAANNYERGINYHSQRGVPLTKAGTVPKPPDSDNRAPDNSGTINQFRGVLSHGSLVRPTGSALSTGLNFEQNAANLGLPRSAQYVLRAGQAGAPIYGRAVSFNFGSVISPPATDENGAPLTGVTPADYWMPEPQTTNNHSGAPYYWSPHAQSVFAIQPGPIQVTWRKRQGSTTLSPNSISIGGLYYPLLTKFYVVSGSAVKSPRKMYWTQASFQKTGVPINIPTARVGAVNIRYSAAFPDRVAQQYVEIGDSQIVTNGFQETRTFWYDEQQNLLLAYNLEGRVFVEFLGDVTGPNTRQHLGFEIVDVFKQPLPSDLTAYLGDKITAYSDGRDDSSLNPSPILTSLGNSFLYTDPSTNPNRPDYYAVQETANPNDVLVHWLEEGVAGLRWPLVFNRYKLTWPTDLTRYSYYVRPLVASEAEAQLTAVSLPSDNAPAIQYQDPLDHPRAKLTDQLKYYTFLDAQHPMHRGLLRFTAGDRVAFERVYSILNTQLQRPLNTGGTVDVSAFAATTNSSRGSFLNLDGTSAYGVLPPDVYLKAGGFTVESWVYVRANAPFMRLFDFNTGNTPAVNTTSGDLFLSLSYSSSAGFPYFSLYRNGATTGDLKPAAPLALNTWVHIAVVQQPSDNNSTAVTTMYINGIKQAETRVAVPSSVQANPLYVGKSNWAPDPLFNGAIDDFRIWSTPRAAADIQDGMAHNYPPGTPGLFAQYGFDEANASVVYDSSGNGHNLALMGGAVLGSDPTVTASAGGLTNLDRSLVPRYFQQTVFVGDRISAPAGELGAAAGQTYQAGYVQSNVGTSYDVRAYQDPFVAGFAAANQGAIIPVNAIPGKNQLEVWWFRRDATNAVQNVGNGFKPVYWPSVIGRYYLAWPDNATNQIVLASNAGSGPLDSLQAAGTIYTQNDSAQPGYNPNEEHALLVGGQAYALRDDLNVTSGSGFSSQPYVLLDYTASDGRPAMRAFKVQREQPANGIVFDYVVSAGSRIQAPMPLPLLPPPVAYLTNGSGTNLTITTTNYNTEPLAAVGGDKPGGWVSSSASGPYGSYAGFTFKDRKNNYWVMRGVHAGPPPLDAGRYNPGTRTFNRTYYIEGVAGLPFTNYIHTSRPIGSLVATVLTSPAYPPLPAGVTFGPLPNGMAVYGTFPATNSNYQLQLSDGDGASVVVGLGTSAVPPGSLSKMDAPLQIQSTNAYTGTLTTLVGRPPLLADPPTPTNCFTMRFYYPSQPGFAWPGIANPPAVGAIVPYLQPAGSQGNPASSNTPSLDIVYRPYWPGAAPAVSFGETLTVARNGRPAIRGQTSANVLYQQAIAQDIANPRPAVVLQDPTREKTFLLGGANLAQVPDGVRSQAYQGKVYFPNLPPHLAQRFFLDPNRGTNGALVFTGQFKDETFGEKYLLLNVLGATDRATVQALCPGTDPNKAKWDAAVAGLTTTVQTFAENPAVPGQFIVNDSLSVKRGVGELAAITNENSAVDSYALSACGPGQGYVTLAVGNGSAFTPATDPISVYVLRVTGSLYRGEIKIITPDNPLSEQITFQHTADLGGKSGDYEYQWKIAPPVNGQPPMADAGMSLYQPLTSGLDVVRYTLGGSGIQTLVDNYVVMRYRPANPSHPLYSALPSATATNWSDWTAPALAEGWVKRVLAGINPFGQRVTDLYNNTINTDVSMLTQAGRRYEGDVALNADTLNDFGLIEIYETVLQRARNLSIDAGINFGPANDTLLLAAGYLNDLYMLVGNEAYADASNPTIGIGTKNNEYGSVATSLFSFQGQVPSLLEEELALLRGRDDTLLPGVQIAPVYNRLVWNYTRGIAAGEVIYALNYNILDQNGDGKIDASDAAVMYPMGHGDAYGHYLTAVKGYYSLIMSPNFDWVPRVETVNVLGVPVTVDYLDERKFAGAAAAEARTGRQIFDLSWRRDYLPGQTLGWDRFSASRVSSRTVQNGGNTDPIVRNWGSDHWAARVMQGTLLNWVVGNAILPDVDPDPTHEGIQKVDRTTVPELQELTTTARDLQAALDSSEARMTPLGLSEGTIPFDLDPVAGIVANGTPTPHFEQVFSRATAALNNAVVAFDDAKDVTRLMRSEEDSRADVSASISEQEMAYTNALIELYGTPYPDDVGPGKTFKQGYSGPDLVHYVYVDNRELTFGESLDPTQPESFQIDLQQFPKSWVHGSSTNLDFSFLQTDDKRDASNYITYVLSPAGYFQKPASWTGSRHSPGEIQQAISDVIKARNAARQALNDAKGKKEELDGMIRLYNAQRTDTKKITDFQAGLATAELIASSAEQANALFEMAQESVKTDILNAAITVSVALPQSVIGGLAVGGDVTSVGRSTVEATGEAAAGVLDKVSIARNAIVTALRVATDAAAVGVEYNNIIPLEQGIEFRQALFDLDQKLGEVQDSTAEINRTLQELDDANRAVASLVAKGERLLQEREVFRQRNAAVIQGFRTRDAAFRLFRNEKLERYKTLFDLASRYAFMAANAYDYDTGLLGTSDGQAFINQIVSSRALGVMVDGQPQFAGSNTGDPGLSSALAEMKADWDVLKGRLGFNSPDAYNTLASLRVENLGIMPDATGDSAWQDFLQRSRVDNLLDDGDVRRYCQQIDPGDGSPLPGFVITFSTTITPEQNIFGKTLAAGGSAYHRSSFATKIHSVGVALEGYRGMHHPGDTNAPYLDPLGLAADPYVYLIPVGSDTMRSPALGDASYLRTWNVDDVAIPLPFNIGSSAYSTLPFYQSADSLTEPLFALRKHQAFRPVDSGDLFTPDTIGVLSPYTNRRLYGRSVWNSRWKLIIPADSLLADPKEGMSRFLQTVTDIKINFNTYSYSGN